MWGIFGNEGAYRMPHTPDFPDRASAAAYARSWWPENRFVVVLPIGATHEGR